ncbi:MAG: DNA polymerase III subunit gamma/tau [Candidatus Omnitrophica bacterium]|nr:DNA polymerase III subunit gamma/tau [Candidatus Omnitrophota bacterium]
MKYQVFALKWRPQTFDQIIGQEHIATVLKNSILRNRVAHAYLFAGPRGVGKTSTARILAKSLNCERGSTVEPCQRCTSCQEITQSRSFDVIEIDGASNRGIDEIRTLREGVKFSPILGHFKIYIIDEVHMLTTEAFNALLKTLEEPPPNVLFIFATTQADKVPATILSRCQRFDFARIATEQIVRQLRKIASQEKIDVNDEALFTIARQSTGSLRDAESILDQLISFTKANSQIKRGDIVSFLGCLEEETVFEITDKIIKGDVKAVLEMTDLLLKRGKNTKTILESLIEHFRNLIVAKVAAGSSLIDLSKEQIIRLVAQSKFFRIEDLFGAFNLLVDTQELSKRLNNSIIPLEISLLRLAIKNGNLPKADR